MYKFIIYLLTLAVAIVLALIFCYATIEKLDDNYYYEAAAPTSEYEQDTYVVKDSFDYDTEESFSYLYHKPTQSKVRMSPEMNNYHYQMEIIGEQDGYALVKDYGYCNVYNPEGKAVFEKDRIYHQDYHHEVTILYHDKLIADYNTGEFFDMQGNPVNNFHTRFNRYYHSHSDIVNVFIFTIIPLVVFFIWYFLLWRPFKRRNTLTLGMKTTYSIVVLLMVLAASLYVTIIIFMFVYRNHDIETAYNMQYEVVEGENENGETIRKLRWYNPDENVKEVVRVSKNTSGDEQLKIGFSSTDFYVVVNDGNLSNVYGPEGKSIFERDLENADLEIVSDGLLISDRNSGKYYDLTGKPVKNFYTKIDKLLYNNEEIILLGLFILFFLVGVYFWRRYSWKKRKLLE